MKKLRELASYVGRPEVKQGNERSVKPGVR